MNKTKRYLFLLTPFLLLAVLYELLPLLMILVNSFRPDSGGSLFTLENYQNIFSKLLYRKAIANSIKISLLSSLIGILIATLGAKALHQHGGKLGSAFLSILNMVSNFAGVPLAFAYMILLGNAGVMVQFGRLNGISALADFDLYTTNGMSLIYVYFQIPLATLLVLPAFAGVRREWQEAASLLGAGGITFWCRIGLPVLLPSILGTFSVLFSNALAAYATAYALMMNSLSLLPIQIAGCFVGEVRVQRGLGSALSVVMMGIMVIMILLTNAIGRSGGRKG